MNIQSGFIKEKLACNFKAIILTEALLAAYGTTNLILGQFSTLHNNRIN